MTNIGALILSVFAAFWGIFGLILAGAPAWSAAVPVAISAAFVLAVQRDRRQIRSASDDRRVGRLVMWASGVEAVGIIIAVNVCIGFGRPDNVPAAIAAVIGLHFIPLARGIPLPSYYVTAGLFLGTSIAGFLFAGTYTAAIVSGACAMILWGTSAGIIASRSRSVATS